MRVYLHGKVRGKVTEVKLDYEGSITIGALLMDKGNIAEHEQVHVVNKNNGERFITYAIRGKDNAICLNGAAARKGIVGDELIIMTYEWR